MDAAPVDLLLLRGRLPEIVLRPGTMLAARVLDRQGERGTILLAGVALAAQLPEGVEAGDRLRLEVREVGSERLLLRVAEQPAVAIPPAGVPLPLPGGGEARVRVTERDDGEGGGPGRPASVAIAWESPVLGRLDLRVELSAGAVSAQVGAAAGEAAERAQAAAGELRDALARATGRPAGVRVVPRRDPLDVYA